MRGSMNNKTEDYAERISKMPKDKVQIMRTNAAHKGREDIVALCITRLMELEKMERLTLREKDWEPGCIEDLILKVHERYEAVKSMQLGRRFVATRTRPMFERWGIVGTAERTVIKGASGGFEALVREGEASSTWEAVIAAFPHHFSKEACVAAHERLNYFLTPDQIGSIINELRDESERLKRK